MQLCCYVLKAVSVTAVRSFNGIKITIPCHLCPVIFLSCERTHGIEWDLAKGTGSLLTLTEVSDLIFPVSYQTV